MVSYFSGIFAHYIHLLYSPDITHIYTYSPSISKRREESLACVCGKKRGQEESSELPAPVFLPGLLGHAWCMFVCLGSAVRTRRWTFGIAHGIRNSWAILNPYQNMRWKLLKKKKIKKKNGARVFGPAFIPELKFCNNELHIHANTEPTSFLSFLSTLFNHSTHQSVTKRLSVGIYVWRALSIDDFMFIPAFPVFRFWNAFVIFSIWFESKPFWKSKLFWIP